VSARSSPRRTRPTTPSSSEGLCDTLARALYTLVAMTIDSNLGKVDEVMTALYDIHDPEIGMSIVDLDLIKAVDIGAEGAPTEIKMVLTTRFCPWAGELIQEVKTKAEEVVGPPVKVTLLAERWEPPPGLF
jgi:metal-sulfur cluster biosynthetic enzyme